MIAPETRDSPPPLWNPNVAANWSLILSPAFGAFLHARNADVLGRQAEAKANRVWFYATLVFQLIALGTIFIPAVPDSAVRMAGLLLLLAWYFSLGTKQIRHIKTFYAGNYPRKPWTRPLLIGFACILSFVAFGMLIAALFNLS